MPPLASTPRMPGRTTVLTVVALLAFACSTRDAALEVPALLPPNIHGLELADAQSGEEASQYIGRLHERDVAPTESHIGFYGTEPMQVVIYVSRFATADQAAAQLSAMATSIGSGSSGYGHHGQMDVGGLEVHAVFGHGQVHHFYAQETDVTWLATPPALARVALAELLNVDVDEVPGPEDQLPSSAGADRPRERA